ncbi:serine/arginine-rich splicing factor SR45a-like [Aristolochia californica]|uniref:serine/arginine-rich splicing factor SR45a-like n=1 Tax=Aristolochia californica TaxID=171875 RepID=UPI0035D94148
MADSPRKRSSRSPSPRRARSRSRSVSRSKSRSRSRGRSWSRSPLRSRSRSLPRSHGRNDAVNPGNTLYVTGLSTRVTERDLEDHFSKEGKVVHCRLVVEPRTRMSRGFGFVTMDNVDNADRCIKYLNQSVLEGRYITVEKSRRKRPRTPTPGNYLGVKSTRESSRHHDRVKYRGGYGHDDYGGGFRRGGRDYSPRRSPYRSTRDRSRSRSVPYSPYGSPDRMGYGRRPDVYTR